MNKKKKDADKTALKLLKTAEKHFAKYGFAGARIDKIASESKINKRMIYEYFQNKKGLYEAVLNKMFTDFLSPDIIKEIWELPVGEKIDYLVKYVFNYFEENNHVPYLLSWASLGSVGEIFGKNFPGIASLDIISKSFESSKDWKKIKKSIDMRLIIIFIFKGVIEIFTGQSLNRYLFSDKYEDEKLKEKWQENLITLIKSGILTQ